ncbi:MAG TPA: FAD-binding oxidoreductase [Steroidobacteraceae bacterium]|jgi:gamma-glutamylputrescine oxidase|nr:FAD-binding oxidoreductase [Steroidobacteraceae bacterium]
MNEGPAAYFVATYYSASTVLPPPAPALQGAVSADVCVVGAGIAGCSAALSLAERGYRVVLLEARRIGWGAFGRSGGQALYGTAAEQADLELLVGIEDARRIWDVSLAGLALLRRRIAEHRIDCDWTAGQMYTAIKPRQWRQLERAQLELTTRYGYSSTRLLGPDDHPLRYTLGLARAAARAGAELHEASEVTGLIHAHGKVRVHTGAGVVECSQLLLTGGAWLGRLAPALARKLMTIASYVIATEPLGEHRARQLIANNAAVCDTNWVLDYFRCSGDNRLLFGGRVNYSGARVRSVAPATLRRMLKVFPQLRGTRIEYAWGCLIDITANRAPHFGRLAPNVYFLQGFSGHGIALAGIAGALVAEAIAGTSERFDVFARIPHRDFPGGALLRRPVLALAMLWYRLQDLL